MTAHTAQILERAAVVICNELPKFRFVSQLARLRERDLWRELVSCLLSSQVKYEVALAATGAVMKSRIERLPSAPIRARTVESTFRNLLRQPLKLQDRRHVRFRFPNAKARQLARTVMTIRSRHCSLKQITYEPSSSSAKRTQLIDLVTGFGPKQASMYIRNTGAAPNVAVLDRHVLQYLAIQGLATETGHVQSLAQYERIERAFETYAASLDLPMGDLDIAIWIVMRVASERRPA